ncbi:hypothetical protein phi5218_007 [Streptococcus phage phi5218]|nr:hypothetical protein phi5218_007 [Streptococcus phage phi5218]
MQGSASHINKQGKAQEENTMANYKLLTQNDILDTAWELADYSDFDSVHHLLEIKRTNLPF